MKRTLLFLGGSAVVLVALYILIPLIQPKELPVNINLESSNTSTIDLTEYGLSSSDPQTVIETLENREGKPLTFMASVRPNEILIGDKENPQTIDLSSEGFYVAVAPYFETTHPCYHHSLTTCDGELKEVDFAVHVENSRGETIIDDTYRSYKNGFFGLWLPRNDVYMLTVSFEGKIATRQITTGAEDPTCITDMMLELED